MLTDDCNYKCNFMQTSRDHIFYTKKYVFQKSVFLTLEESEYLSNST